MRTIALALLFGLASLGLGASALGQAGSGPEGLLAEAQAIMFSDAEAGLELSSAAADAERRSPQPRPDILLRAAWLEGEALFRLGQFDQAADHIRTTLETTTPENTEVYGKLLITSGRVARSRGDDGRALRNFQDAFSVFSEIDSRRYMAIALQALGTLYQNARQYERAVEYIERSAAIYLDDGMLRLAGLNNRANAYAALGRHDEARKLLREALNTEAVQAIPHFSIRILANLASLEVHQGNDRNARIAIERIDQMVADGTMPTAPLLASAVKAQLELAAGQSSKALEILDEAFDEINFEQTTEESKDAHELAYGVYSQLGQFEKAFYHLQAFERLEDIERDIAASANSAISNARFELSIQEREIALLKSERLETQVALIGVRRRQEQLVTGAIILLALGFSGFLIWQTMQSGRVRRITERLNKELESVNQKLRVSNVELEKASSAKTEFLATTSHEVRTPLNAVINLTAHVLDNSTLDNASYEKLSTALKSAEHLHDIVTDVLDVARFEGKRVKAHLTDIDLRSTLSDVINLWRPKAEGKKLELLSDININCATFRTDDKLLRQILSNLLSNAIKFTNEGRVELTASGGTNSPLKIQISDTGIGIDEAHQSVIFDSFRQVENGSTRSFGGTGLGLAICRQIVELLGGSISIHSELDAGTTFTLTLPIHSHTADPVPQVKSTASEPEDIDASLKSIRVLAAEDNAVNAMVIQAILKGKVAGLTIVENGLEAVNAVIDGGFDIILMDKQMPVMDGVEATRRIRALGGLPAQTPIIAVTADAFAEARNELFDAGADDYLAKPVKPDDLKRSIVSNLGARGGEELAQSTSTGQ